MWDEREVTGPVVASWSFLMGLMVLITSCGGWQSPSPVCIPGTQIDQNGRCQVQETESHHLPFRQGYEARITQGFHGYATHRKDLAYAVDFACDEGTPITATRSGVVWSVRKDSKTGCDDPECVEDANYVIVDHGDGTYSSYFHLQYMGAIVEPGESVCRGQVLGLCGETGYASGPHLHYSVMNAQWTTLPVSFAEAQENTGGVVLPRHRYESQNQRLSQCGETEFSSIGRGAFIHRGVVLREPLQSVFADDEDRTMLIEGVYHGEQPSVAVHRREVGEENWIEQCVDVDDEGAFSMEIDWPASVFDDGYYFFMVTGSAEDCQAAGWAWSYRIRVIGEEEPEQVEVEVDRSAPVMPR